MWWLVLPITVAVVLGLAYWWLMRPYSYWPERGVKQGTPWLFFGDNWGTVLRKQTFAEMVEMLYKVAPNARYSGFYQFSKPSLLLRDPELIKEITVKKFDHFVDHRVFIPEDVEPLFAKNVFVLTGKRWRDMRSTLSPAFTSSKMKHMFTLMSQNCEQFVKYFLEQNEQVITVEMKDTITRFTNDVIANTAFGVECDSLRDKNNDFYLMGKELTDFSSLWKFLKVFLYLILPKLVKFFRTRIISRHVNKFFTSLIKNNIESREKNGIVRIDMIHLLLEAQRSGLKHEEYQPIQDTGFATAQESDIHKNPENTKEPITDADITSQALIFFFAGFDSVSSLMCFMSHELAVNPDVQEKLTKEVDETLVACKGELTYEILLGMKYMDMVICESLRKWPVNAAVDRVCTKPYTIEPQNPDEKPVHLEKDDPVWVPIHALHRDPQYYPEPERFDPERFNEENKANIKPYTYLPFGSGPRNCIGSRFALLETKILFFHILSHFQIVPVENTQIPLVLSKKQFTSTAEKGFWLGIKRRSKI